MIAILLLNALFGFQLPHYCPVHEQPEHMINVACNCSVKSSNNRYKQFKEMSTVFVVAHIGCMVSGQTMKT